MGLGQFPFFKRGRSEANLERHPSRNETTYCDEFYTKGIVTGSVMDLVEGACPVTASRSACKEPQVARPRESRKMGTEIMIVAVSQCNGEEGASDSRHLSLHKI